MILEASNRGSVRTLPAAVETATYRSRIMSFIGLATRLGPPGL
jgi:hypothetical protein